MTSLLCAPEVGFLVVEMARAADEEGLRKFAEEGKDLDDPIDSGCGCWTPLQLLCSEGDVRGVALLLSLDAEPGKRVQADDQCTALHIAARFGFAPIVEILAKAGAGTDARDKQGHTPLHFAAVNGHEASVQALLARGAYAHLVDAGGNTALDMAQQAGHSGIVKLLQQNLGEHGDQTTRDRVQKWLEASGLPAYIVPEYMDKFISAGFEDIDMLDNDGVTQEDLAAIGIKRGHQKKLLTWLASKDDADDEDDGSDDDEDDDESDDESDDDDESD